MADIGKEIRTRLLQEQDTEYCRFSSSLLPGVNNILGVRLPILRKLAKELIKKDYKSFLQLKCKYMEEVMLQGMLIGLIKDKPENVLQYIRAFIPKITNWSICDSFCCGLKFTKINKQLVWKEIEPLFFSDKEYEVRFALVMSLNYFIDDDYIDKILKAIEQINHNGYYAKMAAAWALSFCYIKFPQKTYEYLKFSALDLEIKGKTIRKICESYKVSHDEKQKIKTLKQTIGIL